MNNQFVLTCSPSSMPPSTTDMDVDAAMVHVDVDTTKLRINTNTNVDASKCHAKVLAQAEVVELEVVLLPPTKSMMAPLSALLALAFEQHEKEAVANPL